MLVEFSLRYIVLRITFLGESHSTLSIMSNFMSALTG
jgi:hypothetical protein